jgi:hypothetical protein
MVSDKRDLSRGQTSQANSWVARTPSLERWTQGQVSGGTDVLCSSSRSQHLGAYGMHHRCMVRFGFVGIPSHRCGIHSSLSVSPFSYVLR